MITTKFSPSVNIIRDAGKELQYIPTPNAHRIADAISADFKKGIHAFTIIGSYGTGKSSFLWALEKSLKGGGPLNVDLGFKPKKIEILRVVGQYQSLIGYFHEHFDINKDFEGNQQILDCLFQVLEKADLLVIYLDEFGKFLEYAAKNQPEKELYFLQQLAEFANDDRRNVQLITTTHQNFEGYASSLNSETHKVEWKKIRGRFKELTFNEPVEQLLYLAAKRLQGQDKAVDSKMTLARKHHIISDKDHILDELQSELAPLDVISAGTLVEALKLYGQNERSLFSFLESDSHQVGWFHVADVYDYLLNAFYTFLNSPSNSQFRHWQALQGGLERLDVVFGKEVAPAELLYKTIGLLQLYAPHGAQVDAAFLKSYFNTVNAKTVDAVLKRLVDAKLVYYAGYRQSYVLLDGTDVDFDRALMVAGEGIDPSFDLVPVLKDHFEFPVLQAKAVSYELGTPRLFQFEIGAQPTERKPVGDTDGLVNLLFNENLTGTDLKSLSGKQEEAIVYAHFTNMASIREHLFEIQKTKKALADHSDDKVAIREFNNILRSREQLLTHEVMGALFTNKVQWYFHGEVKSVTSNKALNQLLSEVCRVVYPKTPRFINELANKHKISSPIHTARKYYFEHLCNDWRQDDLGFEADKFPPEKTILLSLLKANGMHDNGSLGGPRKENGFDEIWNECLHFLEGAKEEPRFVSELMGFLAQRPYKLKQGLIDFWVPTFLFIQRNDFALYESDRDGTRFVPEVNKDILYNITRYPDKFSVKAFQFSGLRLELFNKYRQVVQQPELKYLSTEAFIESVRPFLIFYKQLNDYAKTTNRLTPEARAFRQAIVHAKDPEQTFFEDIPRALGADLEELANSDKVLKDFTVRLNASIEELKTAYDQLLGRLERFIQSEILGQEVEFGTYKKLFQKRFGGIKEHRLLNNQKVFLMRVQSALDDRDSWLASIGHALLGKPLHQVKDVEEDVLYDRLQHIVLELDNLKEVQKAQKNGDEVIRLQLTSEPHLKASNIHIPKGKGDEVHKLSERIEAQLDKNKSLKLAVLAQLLKKELNK